ncbi:hypothetical protein [Nocardioides sp. CFH 31398]|uniref:hypothetical protein n=1 Tax=Nocardioides sp. CFH 31398 TaxID=2919579 RepID=UPI001F052C32|nr:hypothetical protein [Nocardioides sp. CFH 31398]MCH1868560.1 hypothetical protein [Nocardioides sp. CFH 31398]
MATNSDGQRLTAEAAREALSGLDDDNARLADRVVTPWWYHPVLGAVVAAVALSPALPPSATVAVVALCVVVLALLPVAYRRRYGVRVSQPAGDRSRRMFRWVMAAIVLGIVGGALLGVLAPVWALVPAGLVLVAVVVLGRRYDEALRHDLAAGRR